MMTFLQLSTTETEGPIRPVSSSIHDLKETGGSCRTGPMDVQQDLKRNCMHLLSSLLVLQAWFDCLRLIGLTVYRMEDHGSHATSSSN